MTAPDHAIKPLENILRERGHPYMDFLDTTMARAVEEERRSEQERKAREEAERRAREEAEKRAKDWARQQKEAAAKSLEAFCWDSRWTQNNRHRWDFTGKAYKAIARRHPDADAQSRWTASGGSRSGEGWQTLGAFRRKKEAALAAYEWLRERGEI